MTEQGLALRGARLARNMTQAHLAGLAGVSEKTVRRAEAGDAIRPDSVRALCAALGLDAANLRSEASLRPDVGAAREREMHRRAWAAKAAIACFSLACVLGPLFALSSDATPLIVVGGTFAGLIVLAALPLSLLTLACLFAPTRALVARIPGMARVEGWLAPRVPAMLAVLGIAAGASCVAYLPFALHGLLARPSFDTALYAGMSVLSAAIGVVNTLRCLTEDDVSKGEAPRLWSGPVPSVRAP